MHQTRSWKAKQSKERKTVCGPHNWDHWILLKFRATECKPSKMTNKMYNFRPRQKKKHTKYGTHINKSHSYSTIAVLQLVREHFLLSFSSHFGSYEFGKRRSLNQREYLLKWASYSIRRKISPKNWRKLSEIDLVERSNKERKSKNHVSISSSSIATVTITTTTTTATTKSAELASIS